jgi:phosphoribosylamine--glycine ligase
MKVLVVGSGGREHALVWKLAASPAVTRLLCAPGNAGIARQAEPVRLKADDVCGLLAWAVENRPDLVVVGPERPLVLGLADRLREAGIPVYGPSAAGARLEGSKAFTDELLARHGLSRKEFGVFTDPAAARAFARRHGAPLVVKADGDAFGKGVKVAATVEEAEAFIDRCMVEKIFGPAGETVVLEECLSGPECSVKVFSDGRDVLPMAPAQDYKRIGDGDTGDNTGGMGCYSPVPLLDDKTLAYIISDLILPTVRALADEGTPYVGTLYAGCMLTDRGPEILEYNCRFGDPETQVILPRLDSDLLEILQAAVEGRLLEVRPVWSDDRAVCVVLASGGYPGDYEKGKLITGIDEAEADTGAVVFHAGTAASDGALVTAGGRVLGVTATAPTFAAARGAAYDAIARIQFDGMYCRRDIALRAVEAEQSSA